MKILYIANIRLPTEKAHGIQIMKMCEAFADLGQGVELFVPRRLNPIKAGPFEYYEVNKNFKITKIPCLDLIFISGKLFFLLEFFSFLLFAKIYSFFKKHDLVYTRETLAGYFFKNFVLELHSLPKKISKLDKKTYKKAQKIVVLTSFIKKELVEIGVPQEKILVSPDAVDLQEFAVAIKKEEARKKVGLLLDKKIALYLGSLGLYKWKGVDTVLEAASQYKEINFVLVGGSKEEIEKIKENFNQENIVLIERQPHNITPYFLAAADVLLLPNKAGDIVSEKYTSPLKMFEYMTSGVPIVASNLPSIREILNESNAVLVEPNDPQELARGIMRIMQNTDLGARVSERALLDVKKYSWEKRSKNIVDFAGF